MPKGYPKDPNGGRKGHRRKVTECPHHDKVHHCRGMCVVCYSNFRRQNDPTWLGKHRDRTYYYMLKRKYGINRAQLEEMLTAQNGVCAICGKPETQNKRLAVDHCHNTKKVRGLLCQACNLGIGYLKDRPGIMLKAMAYLAKSTGEEWVELYGSE